MKKGLLVGIFIVIILGSIIILPKSSATSFENINNIGGEVNIYKSSTCGCCLIYSQYFNSKTKPKVNAINIPDINSIREQYGIPLELQSCHITIIGDYFVEGHIPLESIEKLLEEKPDIAGIAMPGMPSGSPGMPGTKYGDFIIYAVNHDKSYNEFMRI